MANLGNNTVAFPGSILRVNRAHPFSRKLQYAFIAHGPTLTDILKPNVVPTTLGTGTTKPEFGAPGRVQRLAAEAIYYSGKPVSSSFTVVVQALVTTMASATTEADKIGTLFGVVRPGNNNFSIDMGNWYGSVSNIYMGGPGLTVASWANGVKFTSGYTFSTNTWYGLGATVTNFGGTGGLYFGKDPAFYRGGALYQLTSGLIACCLVYDGVLPDAVVASLTRDPRQAFETRPVRRAVAVPGTQYTLATDAIAYEHTVGDAGLGWGRRLDTEALAYEHAVGDAGFVVRRTLQAEAVAYGYTVPAVALNYYPAQAEGDTHDGFKRRSRRQRALDAAERRRREAVAQEAVTLRLSLEAAMGMAAEVVEEAPAEAVEAVQAVARKAARLVPTLADTRADEALLASAREAVAALRAAVDEAARAKALAEDDEDVLMLLRAL